MLDRGWPALSASCRNELCCVVWHLQWHNGVMAEAGRSRRPRGRPKNSEGRETSEQLLAAAATACADHGFDGATLTVIANYADVSPNALYNHFDSREDLLHAAAVRSLEQLYAASTAANERGGLPALASAYLGPDARELRRLVTELEAASRRNQRIAELLAQWHREVGETVAPLLPPAGSSSMARTKLVSLILLGLCHLDDLETMDASDDEVAALAGDVIKRLLVADVG